MGHKMKWAEKESKRRSGEMESTVVRIIWMLCALVGACSIVLGATMMIFPTNAPFGLAGLIPYLARFPFYALTGDSLFWCGVAMIAVNGFCNIIATVYFFLKDLGSGLLFAAIAGALLALWCVVQYIFLPNPLALLWWIVGLAECLTCCIVIGKRKRGFSRRHPARR